MSLQVAIDFDAMIARVGDHHTALLCHGQSLGSIQRIGCGVDV